MSGRQSVHAVVGVGRDLGFRIRQGQQIAVGIVRQLRLAIERVDQLRDAIQSIYVILSPILIWIGERQQPPHGIEKPRGDASQRISRGREVALRIGQGGGMVQGIGDSEKVNDRGFIDSPDTVIQCIRDLRHAIEGWSAGERCTIQAPSPPTPRPPSLWNDSGYPRFQ